MLLGVRMKPTRGLISAARSAAFADRPRRTSLSRPGRGATPVRPSWSICSIAISADAGHAGGHGDVERRKAQRSLSWSVQCPLACRPPSAGSRLLGRRWRSRLLGRQRQDQHERGDDGHRVHERPRSLRHHYLPYDLTQVVTIENSYRRHRGACGHRGPDRRPATDRRSRMTHRRRLVNRRAAAARISSRSQGPCRCSLSPFPSRRLCENGKWR